MRKSFTPPYCRHSVMKSLTCRVRTKHGYRIVESQRSAAFKLTVLAILVFNDVCSKQVCELFTRASHHRNISVILITQNLFHQGRYCRDISLNAHYLVVFKTFEKGSSSRT